MWVARLSSGEKLNPPPLLQFFFKDRGKCIWKIKEVTSLSGAQAHVSAASQAAVTAMNSASQTLQWGGRWENYCACPPALGWWIKTVIVTAENRDLFWSSANLFLANLLFMECRLGKDWLRIIKYILAWYLQMDKPPFSVCLLGRQHCWFFWRQRNSGELKTYAKGLYLIEFCWSQANAGAFVTAFKIGRDFWVICTPLKLPQQTPTNVICSSAVTNRVKQALIIFCHMKDIYCSLHW